MKLMQWLIVSSLSAAIVTLLAVLIIYVPKGMMCLGAIMLFAAIARLLYVVLFSNDESADNAAGAI